MLRDAQEAAIAIEAMAQHLTGEPGEVAQARGNLLRYVRSIRAVVAMAHLGAVQSAPGAIHLGLDTAGIA